MKQENETSVRPSHNRGLVGPRVLQVATEVSERTLPLESKPSETAVRGTYECEFAR